LLAGVNSYAYAAGNPLRYSDASGLIIGSLLARVLGPLIGKTAEEAAYSGAVLDVVIGAAAPELPDCIAGVAIGSTVDTLRFVGGVRAVTLSTGTVYGLYGGEAILSSASASVLLPVALAGYGGTEIGTVLSHSYERLRGNSLGSDIYDLVHKP